nr:hypothetical protein [uncultured Rhodopila sp.]
MSIPDPQIGLVLSYSYLWHHEHRAGRQEGAKNRPCVVVFSVLRPDGGNAIVRVVPVTHSPPEKPAAAFELPAAVKRYLGLDAERSWVILDEVNEFGWPGFDLRPVPGAPGSFTYGFLPPRLFNQLMAKLVEVWKQGHGKATPRD